MKVKVPKKKASRKRTAILRRPGPIVKIIREKKTIIKNAKPQNPPASSWINSIRSDNSLDIRVLMILDQFNVGGTETHTLLLTRELLKRGVHVIVVGKAGRMLDAFAALGLPVYEVDFVNNLFEPDEAQQTYIQEQLKRICIEENINVIHAHQVPSGTYANSVAEQLNIPLVFTAHGTYLGEDFQAKLRACRSLICVSPPLKKFYANSFPSVIIPNGIDTIEYDYRPTAAMNFRHQLQIPKDAQVLMYAGRLSWEKANICSNLINTFKVLKQNEFPDAHLIIAGTGRSMNEIRNIVDEIHTELDQQCIHLLGESLNMCSLYSASDCIIGTGRTALEAMSCGKPLIAAGAKGYLGLIKPSLYSSGWNTWFGDHSTPQAWSTELLLNDIKDAFNMSPEEKQNIGWVGRKYVKDRFHITQVTQKTLEVYQHILQEENSLNEKNRYMEKTANRASGDGFA